MDPLFFIYLKMYFQCHILCFVYEILSFFFCVIGFGLSFGFTRQTTTIQFRPFIGVRGDMWLFTLDFGVGCCHHTIIILSSDTLILSCSTFNNAPKQLFYDKYAKTIAATENKIENRFQVYKKKKFVQIKQTVQF